MNAQNETDTLVPNYVLENRSNSYMEGAPDDLGLNSSNLDENFWAVFDEQYLRHSLGWTVTLVVAYLLILIIGIIGNCMVILVVIKRPQMRTVTNMFIMNLAVADLFVIVFCVPATLISNIFTPWVLGLVMCKGVAYVQGVSVCASAYSLAAISLDRCKAIYRPMERSRGLSRRQALCTTCGIWVIAMMLTIPWAVIFDVVYFKKDEISLCVETWENEVHGKIYFLVINLFFCYCLPLILISVSNIIIWCNVSKRKVPQDSASAATIKKMHRKTRHGVLKMLGIVTLAFLLSWLPLYILVTRAKFTENMSDWESGLLDILMPVAQWLGSWNSSINPVLYAFLNSKFRNMFKSLLPKWIPYIHRTQTTVGRNSVFRASITDGSLAVGFTRSLSNSFVRLSRRRRRSTLRRSRKCENICKTHHFSEAQSHDTFLVNRFHGGMNSPTIVVLDGELKNVTGKLKNQNQTNNFTMMKNNIITDL